MSQGQKSHGPEHHKKIYRNKRAKGLVAFQCWVHRNEKESFKSLADMFVKREAPFLADPQAEFLRRESEKLGISIADLIRRIVGQYRGGNSGEE